MRHLPGFLDISHPRAGVVVSAGLAGAARHLRQRSDRFRPALAILATVATARRARRRRRSPPRSTTRSGKVRSSDVVSEPTAVATRPRGMWQPAGVVRACITVAAVAMVAACADRSNPPGQPPTTPPSGPRPTIVVGVVNAAPGCPGPERLDSPCPAIPVPRAVIDVTRDGRAVTSVTADMTGSFRVRLAPGRYDFTAHNVGGYRSRTTRTVIVPTSEPVELTIDSGLR